MNWLLPEYIADALPVEAGRLESLRRKLLDIFAVHGYELVMPPMLEYLDSLLTGSGRDLQHQTFELVDQLSGRTLGIRADMTPQVARIDAHLLNRQGVARLCYCGSVLHTLPASISASRQPLQLGAEIYGHAGIEADGEVLRLLATTLAEAGVVRPRIDLGHVGIFRALAEAAGLNAGQVEELLSLLQAKDVPGIEAVCRDIAEPWAGALRALPGLYGGQEVLARAESLLPSLPAIAAALDNLRRIMQGMPDFDLSLDLADLRGYHYHNGVVFAAYAAGYPAAIARGGRYDGVGAVFGRARPATGFSLDLREVSRLLPAKPEATVILAPQAGSDLALASLIAELRAAGEIVIEQLPGEQAGEGRRCDRRIVAAGGQWIIEASKEI